MIEYGQTSIQIVKRTVAAKLLSLIKLPVDADMKLFINDLFGSYPSLREKFAELYEVVSVDKD